MLLTKLPAQPSLLAASLLGHKLRLDAGMVSTAATVAQPEQQPVFEHRFQETAVKPSTYQEQQAAHKPNVRVKLAKPFTNTAATPTKLPKEPKAI